MKRYSFFWFFLIVTSPTSGQVLKPFSAGDRVAFLGNSITDGGHYHSFIWLYYMTRFPDRPLTIYNAGIGGDRVVEMAKRLDGDVLARNPTKLFITFGMNDSGYGEYLTEGADGFGERIVAESYRNYQQLENRLKVLSDVEVALLGSSPYDERVQKETPEPFIGKHKAMERIVAFQERSARENGWQFFDFNKPITELNSAFQRRDPAFTLSGFDRIHPDNDGHMVMAFLFLQAQGFSGKPIASVEVDVMHGTVPKVENCTVSSLIGNRDSVSFHYLANALPYPLDTVPLTGEYKMRQSDALRVVPFMEEMNKETLRVRGLRPGAYALTIDGVLIGACTAEQLEWGVNLAAYSETPQYQQALAVMHLNEMRWRIERELRSYTWIQYYFFEKRGLLFADDRAALELLDSELAKDKWLAGRREQYALLMHQDVRAAYQAQLDLLVSKIYEINKPLSRLVCIRPLDHRLNIPGNQPVNQ